MLSRVLGLIRDIGMAALFGNGAVMDAFSVAFRIPNLARRLFGEGALTAAFLPVFVQDVETNGKSEAWKLATAILTILAVSLTAAILLAECLLATLYFFMSDLPDVVLLLGLTAVMLPYLLLICLAAQVSAILHALEHFTWPALLPVILNIVWITGIWIVGPLFQSSTVQVYVLSACIVFAGVMQLVTLLPVLRRYGFQFHWDWPATREKVQEVVMAMLPILVGLSITQLNTLSDSLIAWFFSPPVLGGELQPWWGGEFYPLTTGTASALYFAQRLYQFPLGVFGVALGTVLFPVFARSAKRENWQQLCDDLSLGLRLVAVVGIPASVGLCLLAQPLTVAMFQHGLFDQGATAQTADMIVMYGLAVWAYCGLLIVHRGYYACGDRQTPLRVGLFVILFNLTANLSLIWWIGGRGLAAGTAASAIIQFATITFLAHRRIGPLNWRAIRGTLLRAMIATAVMAGVCFTVQQFVSTSEGIVQRVLAVLIPFLASVATYAIVAKLIGINEFQWLISRRRNRDVDDDSTSESTT